MKAVKKTFCVVALLLFLMSPIVANEPPCVIEYDEFGVIIAMSNCPQNSQGVIIAMKAEDASFDWMIEAAVRLSSSVSALF